MSVLSDFQKFVNDMEASSTFKSWCTGHAADCVNWRAYRTALVTVSPPPSPPTMSTSFGKALVDVGVMAVDGGLVAPPPLAAKFTYAINNLAVSFSDASVAGPSGPISGWAWDFGDGATSTAENPVHTYAAPAAYTVRLTITGTAGDGTSTVTHTVTVTVPNTAPPVAAFSESVSGLTVAFSDHSTPGPSGPITGWAWTFGDGATSTAQNPTHTYASAGTRTVTLTVTGTSPDGTNSASQSVTVSVAGTSPLLPPVAGKAWFGSSASGSITIADVETSILNGSRKVDIVHAYRKLDSYDSAAFPGTGDDGASLQAQSDAGRIIFLNFAFKIAGVYPNGTSTWADLAAGNYDTHLTAIADKIAAWHATYGRQLFVSFGAESDGHNGVGTAGTSDGQFANAWQHIYNLFVARGARTACAFVWDPTGYEGNVHHWNGQYPGDAYVDWLAYDPYGKVDPATGAPDANAHLTMGEDESDPGIDDTGLSRFYKWANGAGAKDSGTGLTYTKPGSHTMPIMVAETGLSYNASADAAFLSQYRTWWSDLAALFAAGRYPLIRAWVFFPSIDSYDPRLDVGSGSVASPQAGSILANFRTLAGLSRLNSAAAPSGLSGCYFGARIDGSFYQANYGAPNANDAPFAAADASPNNWDRFEGHAGKAVTCVLWGAGVGVIGYNASAANLVRSRGAFSLFNMFPTNQDVLDWAANTNTRSALSRLDSFAAAVQAVGHPVLLAPMVEMNGNWGYAWQTAQGVTAAQYVAAWRTMHDRISAGTSCASFFWCPNVASGTVPDPTPWFPGASYVDWVGFDAFNKGANQSPSAQMGPTLAIVTGLAPGKPVAMDQVGCEAPTSYPGGKSQWITDFFAFLAANPEIKMFAWYNEVGSPVWPHIEVGNANTTFGGAAQAAFAAGVADSRYISNIVSPTTFPAHGKVPVPA